MSLRLPRTARVLRLAVATVASTYMLTARAAPAAAPPRLAASALVQVNALQGIKTSRSAVQSKIASRLYLGLLHQRNDARLAALPSFRFVKPERDGLVAVDIVVAKTGGMKTVMNAVEALGGVVRSHNYRLGRVSARVHLADLESLAAIAQVRAVRQAAPRFTDAANVSEGDKTHGADEARGFFGTTGAGVKVCVLSDGVDSLAALQTSGDLPPVVDVLPGQAGSGDEGSAMLEIVHDLAPGAALGFATADPDEATFAQNILDLAADGCNIIVDDIIYLDESPFEDGPVAQAVNTVTSGGVLYFSSAGNEGNLDDGTSGTWEGDFKPNGTPAALAGGGLAHDFGDGGQSIAVTANGQVTVLTWAEHYDLSNGVASTDFDLYDMDGGLTTIFDGSFDTQDGSGGDDFPVEISGPAFTGERLVVMQFAAGTTSSVPMFNLIEFRGQLDGDLATNGATRGHSAAAAAFSVAATPAAASFDGISPDGPFPGLFTAANASEDFSSDGPRRILLDTSGNELTPGNRTSTGGTVRQKPDITAADGVSTAAPGFNPFYGTSAAAPHAAAIAALLKSAVPSLTPAQVRTDLLSSAIDIEAGGTDRDTGAGIVMPHAALVTAGAAPQAFLAQGTVTPSQFSGDGDAFIEPNETWNLAIPVTNVGGVSATAISAVLSTATPGVTVVQPASTYPDLAPTASAGNATLYRFSAGAAASCGGTIQFILTVTFAGGSSSPQSFPFTLRLGSPGTPVTTGYTGPAVAIPDAADLSGNSPGAPAAAVLTVSAVTGPVWSVAASLDGTSCSTTAGSTTVGLDHTFVADLVLKLISPAATALTLAQNVDGGGNNFCQTVFDDVASMSIQGVASGAAPFTGTFKPASALGGFGGEAANGTWQLQAQDFFLSDTGNLRAFSLTITPAVCNAVALTSAVTATKTVTGTFAVGGAVTYTVVLSNTGSATQLDNPGNEFIDVLPSGVALVSASATSGTAVATVATNTATWNGSIPAGGSVTITITATVQPAAAGTTVSNQGTVSFDADQNGTNESTGSTDDPGTGAAVDATSFAVPAQSVVTVPTLSPWGLAALALGLGAAAIALRRRRV